MLKVYPQKRYTGRQEGPESTLSGKAIVGYGLERERLRIRRISYPDYFAKQTPGEENVHLLEVFNEGVEEFYLSMVHLGDIDQHGLPPEAIVGRLKEHICFNFLNSYQEL